MIVASLQQYLPLADLAKILVVCLVVAVVAPSAVSVAIVGLDRRARATAAQRSTAGGDALVIAGIAILVGLIVLGLVALIDR